MDKELVLNGIELLKLNKNGYLCIMIKLLRMDFRYNICVLAVLLLVCTGAVAQQRTARQGAFTAQNDTSQTVKAYIDSLMACRERIDSLAEIKAFYGHNVPDGRHYRLFVPLTFYHSAAGRVLAYVPRAKGDDVADAVDAALLHVYLNRPDLVANTESRLKKVGTIRNDIKKPVRHSMELTDKAGTVADEPVYTPVEVMVKRPNFWKFGGDGNMQIMQHYVSENWYKGDESHYSMQAGLTLTANYNNKKRLKFENKLEMKIGIETSRSDTLHKFKTNNDMIRYTGKLGLQAANRWYYTLQVLAYTQFSKGLKSNDKKVYSDFMSPFTLNLGLGMDYSVEALKKRLTGSINLSFLSFNFRYVDRMSLAKNNGIRSNHHTLENFGSQLTTSLTWKITDQIKWQTRLYGYTTYEKSLVEWENTFNLSVSKYISANIFIYPRLDDSRKRDDDWDYWQLKEYCSLGLNYSF